MALHDIREVRIPIELDKPRTLLFDLNAFAELEDKFGSLMSVVIRPSTPPTK